MQGIRKLVCAEFGYRTDQKWGYTVEGSACLYIKDVNLIAENDCLILRQAVALFPGLKWFHCGWITVSRPHLCWISAWTSRSCWRKKQTSSLSCSSLSEQCKSCVEAKLFVTWLRMLAQCEMFTLWLFCKLLNLPYEPFHRYIWDLAKHTPFVTRKRETFSAMWMILSLWLTCSPGRKRMRVRSFSLEAKRFLLLLC